jgi:hypothetical protein
VIRAFLKFYFSRNLGNWRALRRVCRSALPKQDQAAA